MNTVTSLPAKLLRAAEVLSREADGWDHDSQFAVDCREADAAVREAAAALASPTPSAGVGDAAKSLREIRDLIASRPLECLGIGQDSDRRAWPIRDEVTYNLDRIIAALQHPAAPSVGALTVDVSKVSAEESTALGQADFCNFLRYLAEQETGSYNIILNECSRRILAAPSVSPAYDREFIARVLFDYSNIAGGRYDARSVREQAQLISEADNASGEAVTVNRSDAGEGGLPEYFMQDLSHMTGDGLRQAVLAYGERCRLATPEQPSVLESEVLDFITMVPGDRCHRMLVERGWLPPGAEQPLTSMIAEMKAFDAGRERPGSAVQGEATASQALHSVLSYVAYGACDESGLPTGLFATVKEKLDGMPCSRNASHPGSAVQGFWHECPLCHGWSKATPPPAKGESHE